MKIMMVITGLTVGGAERLVVNLADLYARKGHSVTVVYMQGNAVFKPSDSRVRLVGLGMKKTPLGVAVAAVRFHKLVRELQPDVVNTHLVHANIFGRIMRILQPMPCLVTSAHNTHAGGTFRRLAYRITDCMADASTNVSAEAVASFEAAGAVAKGAMHTILNGVDTNVYRRDVHDVLALRDELGVDVKFPVVLAVGRLSEQKNFGGLILAISRLRDRNIHVQTFIVGDGPKRAELTEYCRELGVTDRVTLLGIRRDVRELMSLATLFVLSSHWEGLPMVVLEAMACECPVVSTDCGGVKHLLGDSGFIVKRMSQEALEEGIADALKLSDREKRALGAKARIRVSTKFSLDAAAERYLSIYEHPKCFR